MDQVGLKAYCEYGGTEAVDRFLSGFASESPALADLTVQLAYGKFIADNTLDYHAKALIIVSMLAARNDVPSALEFHKNAFFRHGGSPKSLATILQLQQNPEKMAEILNSDELVNANGKEKCLLALIAASMAMGIKYQQATSDSLTQAIKTGIDRKKVDFCIGLAVPYCGLPVAIQGATILQTQLNSNTR